MKQWRVVLRRFGVRFAICLAILGGLYLLVLGTPWTNQKRPLTDSEKITALRTALDQSYIISGTLANFQESNAVAIFTANQLQAQFQTNTAVLETALRQAPSGVDPLNKRLLDVIDRGKRADTDYRLRLEVLNNALIYDPESTLGSLNLDSDTDKAIRRATAATNGLRQVANNDKTLDGSTKLSVQDAGAKRSIVSPELKKTLLDQAGCLDQLAKQLSAHQSDLASQTRTTCIRNYPDLRLQAFQSLLQPTFGEYRKYTQKAVPSLLKQLDSLVESARQSS